MVACGSLSQTKFWAQNTKLTGSFGKAPNVTLECPFWWRQRVCFDWNGGPAVEPFFVACPMSNHPINDLIINHDVMNYLPGLISPWLSAKDVPNRPGAKGSLEKWYMFSGHTKWLATFMNLGRLKSKFFLFNMVGASEFWHWNHVVSCCFLFWKSQERISVKVLPSTVSGELKTLRSVVSEMQLSVDCALWEVEASSMLPAGADNIYGNILRASHSLKIYAMIDLVHGQFHQN